MTERLRPDDAGLARAAELLAAGAVVAFPTDTVYGVAVSASRPDRLAALFGLKDRPPERRIPMLVADSGQVERAGWRLDGRAHRLVAAFWPGGLTLVLPPTADGGETQAFRAPDHAVALALIARTGPLLATSANVSDQPDTLDADDVLVAFATRQDQLAAVLDGGRVPGGVASTVLDLSVEPARVLREGPIGRDLLSTVVPLAP